jgi:Flp pilus assembly pilin Flp
MRWALGEESPPPKPSEVSTHMKIANWFDVSRLTLRREDGQTMAEYAVVLSLIVLAVVTVIATLAGGINSTLTNVASQL